MGQKQNTKSTSLTVCAHQWRWRPCRAAGTGSARWPGSSQQLETSVPLLGKNSCAERWRWPREECHRWSLGQRLQREVRGQRSSLEHSVFKALDGDLLCSPLGRSMVRRTSSVTSDDRRPFNLRSQNSCRQMVAKQLSIRSHFQFGYTNFSLIVFSSAAVSWCR